MQDSIPLREIGLVGLAGLGLIAALAIGSYSPQDAGFTFTGAGVETHNLIGHAGALFADLVLSLFGWIAWVLPLMLGVIGWRLVWRREETATWPVTVVRTLGWVGVLLGTCVLAQLHFSSGPLLPAGNGGMVGRWFGELGLGLLGWVGLTLLTVIVVLAGAQAAAGFSWLDVAERVGHWLHRFNERVMLLYDYLRDRWHRYERERPARSRPTVEDEDEQEDLEEDLEAEYEADEEYEEEGEEYAEEEDETAAEEPVRTGPRIQRPPPLKRKAMQKKLFRSAAGAGLPDLDLLDNADEKAKGGFSEASLEAMSRLLEIKLRDFGVEAEVVSVLPGPVVTRFEIQPAAGVKVQKISALAKDLARSLAVISVRIVEVIPGKSFVGIEIPNEVRETVRLKELLGSEAFQEAKSPLTLALGKDIAGQPVLADISRMPHLLVAGTTGSGKSVGVNAMLLSILYKATPEDVRLILVDPKMLELSIYEGIPHLLTPVVTDMRDAAHALNWCVGEMERRYKLMAGLGVRNLGGYNKAVKEAIKNGEPLEDPTGALDENGEPRELAPLPFIVVVIDEFADMMMIVGKKVEQLIARIAQKARAAGIHLLLATQRPSVDVITGLIKANIPCRLSFQVSSKVDSRTILDQGGAEQLLGHGDMLFLPPGTALPGRVHGAFVSDDEVHRVATDWQQRGEPQYDPSVLTGGDDEPFVQLDGGHGGGDTEQEDALYDEAVAFVLESRRASISSVQRKLRIGYNRAARLIEAMEMAGVVSSMNSNGSREVLVPNRE
ncbi:MAG: DNA translocase FtsK 4TM domain-containing protein [Pseudomonadales bacterium]|nr:DNA translocase FtsK 4TM domain-containing protein [Pseudomonadales bacterium]MCP5185745.1 DNA translocase FtsK 4TM domain-containing protein [Pseudomonadales bacterium]